MTKKCFSMLLLSAALIVNCSAPLLAAQDRSAPNDNAVAFELRLVPDSDANKSLPRPLPEKNTSASSSEVFLRSDVKSVSLVEDTYGSEVVVRLAESASQRLRRLTEGMVGQKMAIVVNGTVVATPVVREESSEGFAITGLKKEEARQIAAGIKGVDPSKIQASPRSGPPGNDGADWPAYVRNSVWVAPNSKGLDYSWFAPFQVSYHMGACRPAPELVDDMVKSMNLGGWQRLSSDPAFPEKKASFQDNQTAESWDHGWNDYWRDSTGNIIYYQLSYDENVQETTQNACSLRVLAQFWPKALFDASMKLSAEIEKVRGAKTGVQDWPRYVRDNLWLPEALQSPSYSLFDGSYQIAFHARICISAVMTDINAMVKKMASKSWKRLGIDPLNPTQNLTHVRDAKDPRFFSSGLGWRLGIVWDEYWQDREGNTIYYRLGYDTKVKPENPGESFETTVADPCSLKGTAIYYPADVWKAGMEYFTEFRKYVPDKAVYPSSVHPAK